MILCHGDLTYVILKKPVPKILHIISAIGSAISASTVTVGTKRVYLSKIEQITVRLVSRDVTVVTANHLCVQVLVFVA